MTILFSPIISYTNRFLVFEEFLVFLLGFWRIRRLMGIIDKVSSYANFIHIILQYYATIYNTIAILFATTADNGFSFNIG